MIRELVDRAAEIKEPVSWFPCIMLEAASLCLVRHAVARLMANWEGCQRKEGGLGPNCAALSFTQALEFFHGNSSGADKRELPEPGQQYRARCGSRPMESPWPRVLLLT